MRTLFSSSSTGLVARLENYLAQVTGTRGTLTTQTETFARQSKSIDEQIASMERRLSQQRSLLEQSFISMEVAQSRMQSQLSALNNAFGTKTS